MQMTWFGLAVYPSRYLSGSLAAVGAPADSLNGDRGSPLGRAALLL